MTPARRVTQFRRLHETGCFVMPNPWDIGSARILVSLGFPAIATTSAGLAWSLGRRDNEISLEVSLSHPRIAKGSDGRGLGPGSSSTFRPRFQFPNFHSIAAGSG